MDYFKIQNNLLKLACKKDNLYSFNYNVEKEHVILTHVCYLVRIPVNEWFLDTEKIFSSKTPINFDYKKITDNVTRIKLTNDLVIQDKKTLRKFVNKDGQGIYVDENYLKIFTNDKYDHLYYEGSTPKAPVIINSESDGFLGVILPVNN